MYERIFPDRLTKVRDRLMSNGAGEKLLDESNGESNTERSKKKELI
jgi:hypothetical protein